MSARPKWSREELEAARSRVRSALEETSAAEAVVAPAAEAAPPHGVPLGPAFRAAAVMSKFRIGDLREVAADADELQHLQARSIELREKGWRTIAPELRNAILSASVSELHGLLSRHKRDGDPLQVALQKALYGFTRETLRTMSASELAALVQIWDSLFVAHPLFPRDLVERRLELARLLEPLRQITRTFSGRAAEMQQLRDYVGVLSTGSWIGDGLRAVGDFLFKPVPKGPFLIHGPGGVGKTTLTAKFILEHALAAEKQQFPFAYLDFDRPTVNADEPPTILIEAVRQIGLQYDSAFTASERLRERWQARLARGADSESFVRDFIGFLETLEVREGPVLFVFDTFEEVQRRSSVYARGIMLLTGRLSVMVPRLRVVIAGRSPFDDGTYLGGQLALGAFDHDSAVAYLQNNDVDARSAELIAERTRGNPLTLTLAIELYRRDPAELRQLDAAQLTDEIIQSFLFDRILLHIPDPEVRRLAHPGLVLRRVTPEIIRDVLAKPCGIDVPDLQRAEELLDKLATDTTLVTRVDPRTLVHRSDVRRLMLKPLREHQPETVEKIHRAAIEFYRNDSDVIARAEVAYHSLSLGEKAELTPELEPLLVNALEELAPAAQVLLADAYKLELPQATWSMADQESWERATARKVEQLMAVDDPDGAAKLLAENAYRSAHTELLIVEARAHLAFANVDGARAVAHRGITIYRGAGHSTLLFRMLLVAAEIERRTNSFDTAYSFLSDAEEIARRRNDDLLLVQVLTARADVGWVDDIIEEPEFLAEIARTAERVPDDVWMREKELLQRVIVHVGTNHPAAAVRAARLGLLDDAELAQGLIDNPSPSLLGTLDVRLSQRLHPAKTLFATPAVPTQNVKLRAAQREQLRNLLVTHYGGDLAGFLERRYSRALEALSFGEDDLPRNAMDLVRAAERERWLNDLIIGLWRSRFLSPDVLAFIDTIGLGPQVRVSKGETAVPEKQLRALLAEHRIGIAALEARTCRIISGGVQIGSGFLIDDNVVVTGTFQFERPALEFDRIVLKGRLLTDATHVLRSRLAPSRGMRMPLRDFIEDGFAARPLDSYRAAAGAPVRGFVELPKAPRLDPSKPIFWLWREQDGTFLSGMTRIEGPFENAMPHLSGAPCFDASLNVVGIFDGFTIQPIYEP